MAAAETAVGVPLMTPVEGAIDNPAGNEAEKVIRESFTDGAAVGVQLVGGEAISADWVISAADGYSTIYRMLAGKFSSSATKRAGIYEADCSNNAD